MRPEQFYEVLDDLWKASNDARRLMLARRIEREACPQRWFSAQDWRAFEAVCIAAGVTHKEWSSPPPAIGESKVLLWDEVARRGSVAPLVAHARVRRQVLPALRYELEVALAGLHAAAGARCRRLPPLFLNQIEIDAVGVKGASLGVAACAAWLSRALNVAPAAGVVASGKVRRDGELGTVEFLPAKLTALREAHPHINTVVVAKDQPECEVPNGLSLVRAAEVGEALLKMGLDLCNLEEAHRDYYERKLLDLEQEERKTLSTDRWLEVSREAIEVSKGLYEYGEDERALRGRVCAALCALHGGDPELCESILKDALPATLPPVLSAVLAVTGAARAIDAWVLDAAKPDPVSIARDAVTRAESLTADREREEVLGRAYGTLGRALAHTHAFEEALPELRKGVEFHRERHKRAMARSMTYVAQCQRVMGEPTQALRTIEVALELAKDKRTQDAKTELFLRLERGRCLLHVQRASEAISDFDLVDRGQEFPSDYPRLGALRGLARAYRALGKHEAAEASLQAVLSVTEVQNPMLVQVAALGAGEALVDGVRDEGTLRRIWEKSFPKETSSEQIAKRVGTYLY